MRWGPSGACTGGAYVGHGGGASAAAAALTAKKDSARATRATRLYRPNTAVRIEDHAVDDRAAGHRVGPKEVGRGAGGARWVLQLGSRRRMRVRAPAAFAVVPVPVPVVVLELVVIEEIVVLVGFCVELGVHACVVAAVGGSGHAHAHWGMPVRVSVRLMLLGIREAVVRREGESRVVRSGRERHRRRPGQGRDYVRHGYWQLFSGVGMGLGRCSRSRRGMGVLYAACALRHPGILHEHRLILILILWMGK